MCGSEVTPKPQGITPAAQRLLRQARAVMAADGDVPSPCVSVCRMSDETQLCEGCWRNLDEIAIWSRCADDYKKAVWAQLPERIHAHFSGS
jgi:predicted Fe-S protein YdhL (DUF1289 family)